MRYPILCLWVLWVCTSCSFTEKKTLAVPSCLLAIEQDSLTEAQWATRVAILKLDKVPNAENVALYQLAKMMAMQRIAQQQGYPLLPQYLQLESHRIDAATLLPEKLAQIKALCKDTLMYQQVFIKESLAERWLSLQFYKNEKLQQEQAAKTVKLFGEYLVHPEKMDKDSSMYEFWLSDNGIEPIEKIKIDTATISKIIDQSPNTKPKDVEAKMAAQQDQQQALTTEQLMTAVENLKPKQLYPTVLELPQEFWILQYVGQKGSKKRVKVVRIPKANFSLWLEKEIAQTPIKILDNKAWEAMLTTIPTAKALFANAR